jgi:hypothetical protein
MLKDLIKINSGYGVRVSVPDVFIRDDDVWIVDGNFLELFSFLIEKKIPVIYGIIPARLDKGMASFLRKAKRKYPDLLDIVQHGYAHENYALRGQAKYEFGPGRTYQQQYHDIAKGWEILRKQFGRLWTPGFIPPYHGYDQATLNVVVKLQIPLFSAGKKAFASGNVLDFPARVSLNKYDKNSVPLPFDLRSMLTRTLSKLEPGKVTGLVYHHRAIKTTADMKAIKEFLRGVVKWRDQGRLRLVLFSDFLANRICPKKKII